MECNEFENVNFSVNGHLKPKEPYTFLHQTVVGKNLQVFVTIS